MSKRSSDSCRSILYYRLGGSGCLAVGGQCDGACVSGAEGALIFLPSLFHLLRFFSMYLTHILFHFGPAFHDLCAFFLSYVSDIFT